MTRQQLLTELNKKDTATLEKLVSFSNLLIIPDNEALIKVTMTDMVDKAHAIADDVFSEWTDRTKADFGEFLVELMALFSWKDYWYINGFTLEGFMQKTKNYNQLALHALRLNYMPRYTRSMKLENPVLNVVGIPAEGIVVEPGDLEVQYPESDIVFTNLEQFTISTEGDSAYSGVDLFSGKLNRVSTRFNGISIRLTGLKNVFFHYPDNPQIPITLKVDGVQWQRRDTFVDSGALSTHFMVLPGDGDEFEIVFGKDGIGKRPNLDAICDITFLSNNADITEDLPAAPLTITRNVEGQYIESVILQIKADGVPKAETLEELRQNASLASRYKNNQAIKNGDDGINALLAAGYVKAQAFTIGRMYYFTVIKPDGTEATQGDVIAAGNTYLTGLISGFVKMPSTTNYVTLTGLVLKATIYNEFSRNDIEERLRAYIDFITDPLQGANYGVGFDGGRVVQETIATIPGLSNLEVMSVNGGAPSNVQLTALQIFNKIDQNNVEINFVKI